MSATPSKAGPILAWIGVGLQTGWPVGVAGTIVGMVSAFAGLGASGVGDPSKLSAAIGEVLVSTFTDILVASVGLIPLIVSVTFYRYRVRWRFWFCTIHGGFLTLLANPLGLFLLIFALVKRCEFLHPSGTEPVPSHGRYSTRYYR